MQLITIQFISLLPWSNGDHDDDDNDVDDDDDDDGDDGV